MSVMADLENKPESHRLWHVALPSPPGLDLDALREYAATWRRIAKGWVALAKDRDHDRATRLRRTAQTALYAAHEIDVLLARHQPAETRHGPLGPTRAAVRPHVVTIANVRAVSDHLAFSCDREGKRISSTREGLDLSP